MSTLLASELAEKAWNVLDFWLLRARAKHAGLLQFGHNSSGKAPKMAIRINFSALLFAIISDKSELEECHALGAGLRACTCAAHPRRGISRE
jgi:hypothetical protein